MRVLFKFAGLLLILNHKSPVRHFNYNVIDEEARPSSSLKPCLLTFSGFAAAPTSNPLPAPPTMALSELLKTQLDLTENFLRAQKRLYRSYCESLQEAVAERQSTRRRRHQKGEDSGASDKVDFL